jgi:hypothetical protein
MFLGKRKEKKKTRNFWQYIFSNIAKFAIKKNTAYHLKELATQKSFLWPL